MCPGCGAKINSASSDSGLISLCTACWEEWHAMAFAKPTQPPPERAPFVKVTETPIANLDPPYNSDLWHGDKDAWNFWAMLPEAHAAAGRIRVTVEFWPEDNAKP